MTRPRTPSSSIRGTDHFGRRLVSAFTLVLLFQFGTAVWFMVGQGYDRATAGLVPWGGLLALPLVALLIRAGMPRGPGTRWGRLGRAMLAAAGLYVLAVLGPAWIILSLLDLGSPFSEFWWILGISSPALILMLTLLKTPAGRQWLFGALLAGGGGVGILLVRAFVFSFF